MKKIKSIKDIENLVKWFCKKFTMEELFIAASVILAVLNNKRKDIKCKESSDNVLNKIYCSHCGAPGKFLYYNDGRKRTQIRCKVCSRLSPVTKNYRPRKTKYWCPHCNYALFGHKENDSVTVYKCPNYKCLEYQKNLNKLSKKEKE